MKLKKFHVTIWSDKNNLLWVGLFKATDFMLLCKVVEKRCNKCFGYNKDINIKIVLQK